MPWIWLRFFFFRSRQIWFNPYSNIGHSYSLSKPIRANCFWKANGKHTFPWYLSTWLLQITFPCAISRGLPSKHVCCQDQRSNDRKLLPSTGIVEHYPTYLNIFPNLKTLMINTFDWWANTPYSEKAPCLSEASKSSLKFLLISNILSSELSYNYLPFKNTIKHRVKILGKLAFLYQVMHKQS